MGEQGPTPGKRGSLRGPKLQLAIYDEAAFWRPRHDVAQWTRRIQQTAGGYEAHAIEVGGRRSGKTLRAVERAAALAQRGLNTRVVVPHWFHTRAAQAAMEGYRGWWECATCDAPVEIPPFSYDGEFPPIRSCGFRPEPLGP